MTKFRLNPLRAPLVYRRWLALAPMLAPALALAGPTGGEVIAGQVHIGQPDALTTLVQQASQNAVVNWQQFNVGGQELVQFIQPSASAAILNRIVGGSPSEILGNISANGRVFLINTQGVMFGAGSRVDVAGLVATTLDIADADFMNGRYVLAGNGSGAGVVNQGQISAADGGFVILAGDSARNSGLIQARLGDIVLASGSAMTLDLAGDGLINYRVDGAALSQAAGVANSGQLLADGGRVLMSAEVARGLVRDVVNNSGLIRAAGVAEENGEIVLVAAGGNAVNTGTLDASSAGGFGGSVQVLGDRDVRVDAGVIDASGAQGGGEIRLGGGIEGGEGLVQAERLYVAEAATVRADATVLGDGGRIAAYSQDHSVLAGMLSARGGSAGGNGGFVETSSAGLLTVTRIPELSGQQSGHWLIDPNDIDLVAGSGYGGINNSNPFEATGESAQLGIDLVTGALANGSSVTISTGSSGSQAGNINLLGALDYNGTGSGSLSLNAAGGIFLLDRIFDSVAGGDSLSLSLNAGGNIVIGSAIDLGSGATANLNAGDRVLNALAFDISNPNADLANQITASSVNLVAVNGIGVDAVNAANRIVVSAGNISAHISGDGDMVLRSVSGTDVNFSDLSIAGIGSINANHRSLVAGAESGLAHFQYVAVADGSAQIGNLQGSVIIDTAMAGGASEGAGALLAFAGDGSLVTNRSLGLGTLSATQSVDVSAGGDIYGIGIGYNVITQSFQASFTSGAVTLATDVTNFSTDGAFGTGLLSSISLNEKDDLNLGNVSAGEFQLIAGGTVTLASGMLLESTQQGIYFDAQSLNLAGQLNSAAEIYAYARAGNISGAGDYTAVGYIDLYASEDSYGGSAPGDVLVDQLHAGGGIYIGASGHVQLGANSGYGDVVTGQDYVSIYGDSISSSGNIIVSSIHGDANLDISAEAGSIDIAGSLVAVSDYGGANLFADAYQGTVYNPQTDSYETVGGNISVGSVHVRAATFSSPQASPRYGYDLLSYQPAASALLAADGDIVIGDVRVESYTPLLYASYGGDETLSAASAQLLINPGSHSSAGTVSLGKVEVYGYGDAHALIRGTGSVNLSGGLIVQSFVAQYQRDESLTCNCSNPLTETILLGNATVDIGEFLNYNTQTLAGNGYSTDLASQDFEVGLGFLNVQGPNALARISAGSLEIGTDSDPESSSFGYSVLVQGHIGVNTQTEFLAEASHTIADSAGQIVYQDNISQAQAEFITSSSAAPGHDSQLYRGQVRVGGREAGLSLQAANGGSIRVADAMIGDQLVRGSVEVEGLGYIVDGDYYDYAYGGRSFDSYGLFLRPSLIDAPVVTQFDDSSPSPYLHWGSAGFRVVGGEFVPYDPQNPSYGGYLNDAAAGSLSIAGDLSIHGVGNAGGELWADQINLGTAGRGDSVSVSASRGEVFGEQGIAYDYGYYVYVEPEYYSVTDPVTSEVYTYQVRRQVSGNLAVNTSQGGVMAATAGLAGLNFEGVDSLLINGDLNLSGLNAEVGINDFASATITGGVNLDGRPDGSSPGYFREDVSFVGAFGSTPPALASASSVLIGGRSGMQVTAQSLRIGNGIDIRGTLIAGLLIDSADAVITGDVRIDAVTGHIESDDPTTTSEAVNVDLGLAAIRLGTADGAPVRIVAGGDGSGSLTVIGSTEVDLGGLNLVADGDVLFDASTVRQSMRDLVEQFEHPFSHHDDGYGGNPMLAASPTDSSGTLSDLLNSSSRICYTDIANCGFLVSTQSGGDITLIGGLIETGQGNFEAGGNFRATAYNALSLGSVVSTGTLTLHNSGDLSLSGNLAGASVTLLTDGSFSNPEALSINAGPGGVSIEAGSISSSGLLSISSAGGLHLSAGTIDLAGYDLSATGEARLEGTTLNLGAGELSAGSLVLAAVNALNLTGSSLASGGTATLSGGSVQLSDAFVEAVGSLSVTSNNALTVTSGSDLRANSLSLTGKTVTLSAASSLDAGSVTVGSTGLLKLDGAQIFSGGALNLSSSGGSVALSNGSLLRGRNIQLSGKGAVSVENSRLEILGTMVESTSKVLATYPVGSISLQGAGLTLRNAQLAGGDISLLGGAGLITLDGGSIEGNIVRIEADSVTTPSAVQISANGFGARGAILDFGLASFNFGTGAAPFGDDNGLFVALPTEDADLLPSAARPNASFVASELLSVGAIGGSAQYLLFDASDFTFEGEVRGATDLFLQVIPSDDQAPLEITDLGFARFARTLAIGGADYVGDILLIDHSQLPANKALSAGTDTNYIFLTQGRVLGVDSISTNGRVVVIESGGVPQSIQDAPVEDLVLVSSDFLPSSSGTGEDENGLDNPLAPGRHLPGHGTVSSDNSSDTQQQCDAI